MLGSLDVEKLTERVYLLLSGIGVDNPFEGKWDGTEKAILYKCEEMWHSNLKKWEAPYMPEEKIKALGNLLARAKKEFNID